LAIDRSLFPQRPAHFIPINRVPVLYRPILGSPEQFVVGVLCFNYSGCHLERANKLERLSCLFGGNCDGVLLAIGLALDVLEAAIQRPDFSIDHFESAVSGMCLGESHVTEGPSLEAAAQAWLSAHSSLFSILEPCHDN
jgi:hypothetical protein